MKKIKVWILVLVLGLFGCSSDSEPVPCDEFLDSNGQTYQVREEWNGDTFTSWYTALGGLRVTHKTCDDLPASITLVDGTSQESWIQAGSYKRVNDLPNVISVDTDGTTYKYWLGYSATNPFFVYRDGKPMKSITDSNGILQSEEWFKIDHKVELEEDYPIKIKDWTNSNGIPVCKYLYKGDVINDSECSNESDLDIKYGIVK